MSTIVTRAGKGSPLTHTEVDANFTNLNTDKLEVGASFNAAVAATPAVTANTAKVTNATHTGDVTGATALTIANDAVTNAKAANMATARIKGRVTAGTGDPEDLTGTQATALLDTFTSGAKGLVPASGGGTTNFLRADGSWAAPGGGGGGGSGDVVGPALATDNAIARFDTTTGKLIQNSGATLDDNGVLNLPSAPMPSAPSASTMHMFARSVGGRMMPAWMGPTGLDSPVQPLFGLNRVAIWRPGGNGTAVTIFGMPAIGVSGTASAENVAATNLYTRMARIAYRITTASTSATADWRGGGLQYSVGAASAGLGGFFTVIRWGISTGGTTATTRAFAGMRGDTNLATDVNPSSQINICGMGWDSGDTNIQFMHNDGSGTATKIDLGSSFPRPSANTTDVMEIVLFAPPGTTQSVSYRVTRLDTGDTTSGTVTTDLPSTTQFLAPRANISVGGTSSVIGLTIMSVYVETDY